MLICISKIKRKKNEKYSEIGKNFKIIYIPININNLDQNIISNKGIEFAYNTFKGSNNFFFNGIYNEIIGNDQVFIGNNKIGIYEYLLQQNYSFGISKFSSMAGAFAVFEVLGIKNTFNITASVFDVRYLHFLEDNEGNSINVIQFKIPDFKEVLPGDWEKDAEIWKEGSERYIRRQINYQNLINITNKMPSNFIKLFKKIKYYFVNQNIHGIFKPFPLHNKIVYIGGIHIEENNKINIYKKEFNEHEYHCVVLVSFGTVKMFGDLNIEDIKIMFYNFSFYDCLFKVRINKEYIKGIYINNNIQIIEEFIDQQKILFETNTKLFISHCGQHSLTEAIYGGIPLICIPNGGDQFYNSSIVEHLNIGNYVHLKMMEQFPNALKNLMKKGNIYKKEALLLRKIIINDLREKGSKKKIFLEKF